MNEIESLRQQLAEQAEAIDLQLHTNRRIVQLEQHVALLREQLAEREKQIKLYEQALLASWPEGAIGEAFDFWNTARRLATTEPKP